MNIAEFIREKNDTVVNTAHCYETLKSTFLKRKKDWKEGKIG